MSWRTGNGDREHPCTVGTREDLGDLWRDAGYPVLARAAYESARAGADPSRQDRERDDYGARLATAAEGTPTQ